jgi:hypothetical protein
MNLGEWLIASFLVLGLVNIALWPEIADHLVNATGKPRKFFTIQYFPLRVIAYREHYTGRYRVLMWSGIFSFIALALVFIALVYVTSTPNGQETTLECYQKQNSKAEFIKDC